MRSLIIATLAAILIVGISIGTHLAQAASSGSYHQALAVGGMNGAALNTSLVIGGPPQGWIPGGDYQLTCRDISTDGYMLKASCQKTDGGWRSTSLDTRNCRSQIVNEDGNLRCTQGGPGYGRPPGGGWASYQQTCRDIRNDGSVLRATCQKVDGSWRSTSLDTRSCRNQIVNEDGHLRCAAGGGPGYGVGGIPPGDYRLTCENIRVNGQRLDASCKKEDGSWRQTSLDNFYRCGNRISNVDGRLRCGQ